MKFLFTQACLWLVIVAVAQQKIQPGFNNREYADLLSLAFYSKLKPDSLSSYRTDKSYQLAYRSPEVGLLNRWTLYLRNDDVAIIDIRGTVNKNASWLANFYAAMIPATGRLQLNDSTTFDYQLAADPRAAVHVGWTISLAYIAPDITDKIRQYYTGKKIKEFFIFGHSQGGGIAFLLRSYLEYEMKKGHLPADLQIKTYCSAAPKPGNTYYAYDFDFITRNGWGFNVVNAADWVPETPFSIQQVTDMNAPNPIINAKTALNKQKLIIRLAGKSIFNKMERKPRKAQRMHEKYLGHAIYKRAVKKVLPQLKEPAYEHDANYTRAGVPIVLIPDETYWQKFPNSPDKYFAHHLYDAYHFLLVKYYPLQ